MNIRTKIIIPFIVLLFILIFCFLYFLYYVYQVQRFIERQTINAQKVYEYTNILNNIRLESQTVLLSYRYTRDDNSLAQIFSNKQKVDAIMHDIQPYLTTQEGKKLLDDYNKSRIPLQKARREFIDASKTENDALIRQKYSVWKIYAENSTIALANFTAYNFQQVERSALLYKDLTSKVFYLMVFITLLFSLFIITFAFYLRIIITVPISKLSSAAREISEGKFNTQLQVASNDELGYLARNLQDMSKKLQRYYRHLQKEVKRKEEIIKKNKIFETQKDNFISITSHELKTPVTSLKVFEQFMLQKAKKHKDKEYQVYLEKMDKQITKLTNLITNLLDISKIQTGKMPFEVKLFDLNPIINDIIEVNQKTHPSHMISKKGKVNKSIFGDEDRISQVINNLITNAVKYSPDSDKVNITVTNQKTHVIISVQDYGIGIDKKHIKRIFDRFYRVSGNSGITFPGLGIGLHISSEIAKRHGGKITASSEKGKGSIFSFYLPYHAKINNAAG